MTCGGAQLVRWRGVACAVSTKRRTTARQTISARTCIKLAQLWTFCKKPHLWAPVSQIADPRIVAAPEIRGFDPGIGAFPRLCINARSNSDLRGLTVFNRSAALLAPQMNVHTADSAASDDDIGEAGISLLQVGRVLWAQRLLIVGSALLAVEHRLRGLLSPCEVFSGLPSGLIAGVALHA